MASADFQQRIATMRQNIEGARQNLKDGAGRARGLVPVGTYVGFLIKCAPEFSKRNGIAQLMRQYHVTVGDYKGKAVRDYQNIENDVGIAIACEFLQAHAFEATPDDIFDLAQSEQQGSFVFSEDFQNACADIAKEQPACQFSVEKRPAPDGQRMFTDVTVIEWIKRSGSGDQVATSPVAAPGTATPPPPPPPPVESEQDKAVRALALKLKLEVNDQMSVDDIKQTIMQYEYPVTGVTVQQLVAKGFNEADITEDSFITVEEGNLLSAIGLGEIVILPDPQYAPPPPPPPAAAAPAGRRMMRRRG